VTARSDLLGTRLAVLVTGRNAAGEEDWALLAGVVREHRGELLLARASGEIRILDEWIARIRVADEEAQKTLQGADYVLQLTVGDGPNEVPVEQVRAAGLSWPRPG
jgi:hypothetical protein